MKYDEQGDNYLIRAELQETKDEGKAQMVTGLGRDSESVGGKTGVLRIQMFGHTSNVPKGAHGIMLVLNGNMDQAVMLGLEHPDHRPTGLESGDDKSYDSRGQFRHYKSDQVHMQVKKLVIDVEGAVIINSNDINLGGTGGKPVAVEGTITSDGARCVSNLATRVKAV
jgi:phage gp45-like